MNKKMMLAAAALAAAVPAAASAVPVAKVPVYVASDQSSFLSIRKGYSDLHFSFASGAHSLSDPYTTGGVTFAATGGLAGYNYSWLNNGKSFLVSGGDLTVTYGGSVLGLTLESATTQTVKYTANDSTTGFLTLKAYTPTFVGFDNSGVRYSASTGLKIFFDGSSCSDAIAVLGFQTAVPEASTWAMMMVGVGLTGAALRRRRPAARTLTRFA